MNKHLQEKYSSVPSEHCCALPVEEATEEWAQRRPRGLPSRLQLCDARLVVLCCAHVVQQRNDHGLRT